MYNTYWMFQWELTYFTSQFFSAVIQYKFVSGYLIQKEYNLNHQKITRNIMQAYGLGLFIEETCIDWLFWRFPSLVNKQSQYLLQKCIISVFCLSSYCLESLYKLRNSNTIWNSSKYCESEDAVLQILLYLIMDTNKMYYHLHRKKYFSKE